MIADPAARSPDDAALLAAVLADLPSDLPKLVYADWLDDHGDPRGDFLRRFNRTGPTVEFPPQPPGTPAGWLALTGCELLAGLRANDLGHLTEPLLRLARPTLFLTAQRAGPEPLPVGVSRFGGDPDLPADTDWPADINGPLPFLAQIGFADFVGSPAAGVLPTDGQLSVFYDGDGWHEGHRGWRLVHTPGGVPLVRRPTPPEAIREYVSVTPVCQLAVAEGLDIPDLESPWADELDLDEAGYGPRREAYRQLRGPESQHHLLGYPRLIQDDVLRSAERRHLLSLASDRVPGWCWSDWGTMYFTLPANALAAGRLADGVRFEMQCS